MNWKVLTILLSTCILEFSNAFPARATVNVQDDGHGETTSQPFDLVTNHNGFGIGAAAGIGGLGASAGMGSFHVDTKGDPFLPFGAFAGINLPNQGGRIGAGCTGLNCGVQLGEFVLTLPNIFSAASNITTITRLQQSSSFSDAVGQPKPDDSGSGDNKTQGLHSILRTRIDGRPNTVGVDQGQNLFRNLLGGLRDFRTTLAGFFREPEMKVPTSVSSASTTAPHSISMNTTNGPDPSPAKVEVVSENEVIKN